MHACDFVCEPSTAMEQVESSDPPLLEDGPPRSPVDAMDDDRGVQLSQSERLHMQQVRELDAEELEVEEVGSDMDVDRSDDSRCVFTMLVLFSC